MNVQSSRPCFAVDIDNVLARAEREVQRLYWELTGTVWPRGRYGSAGGLDLGSFDPKIIEGIFTRFHEESIPVLPMLPGSKTVLNLLRHRYRILIVTARRPNSRPQTLAWLRAHRIPFRRVVSCRGIKPRFQNRLPWRSMIILSTPRAIANLGLGCS